MWSRIQEIMWTSVANILTIIFITFTGISKQDKTHHWSLLDISTQQPSIKKRTLRSTFIFTEMQKVKGSCRSPTLIHRIVQCISVLWEKAQCHGYLLPTSKTYCFIAMYAICTSPAATATESNRNDWSYSVLVWNIPWKYYTVCNITFLVSDILYVWARDASYVIRHLLFITAPSMKTVSYCAGWLYPMNLYFCHVLPLFIISFLPIITKSYVRLWNASISCLA